MYAHRSSGVTAVMIVLTITFGPVVLPIIILVITVVWLIFAKHAWRPLILASAMITGVIVANTLAQIVHRHRPSADFMLIGHDATFSFPSGHVLGASDFLILTAFLIVSRRPKAWGVALGLGLAGSVFSPKCSAECISAITGSPIPSRLSPSP